MALKFFKENLPWIVPSVAIVFAASGYFDRGSRSDVAPASASSQIQANANQPVQAASTTWSQAGLLQNGTDQDQVVTRAVSGITANVTSVAASQNQPSFTDNQLNSATVLAAVRSQAVQPQQPSTQVASFDQNPAAFFRDAQASLQAANSCKEDLQALTARAHVYFPSGGLTAEEAGLQQARLIGTVMQGCKGVGILVTGHSDPSGDPAVNLRLSQKRAEFVIQLISASGLDTSSFVPQGFGDRRPSNVTGPKSRAYYDRRVEFSVVDLQTNVSFNTARAEAFMPACVSSLQAAVLATKLYYPARSIAAPSTELERVVDLAKQAAACPQARLRIIGQHSDDVWAKENVHTGILRAKALMSVIIGQGVPSEQVIMAAPSRSIGVEGKPELSNSRVDFDIIIDPV
ncbi:MAG: outer membrane protein OmpA-like peptidoglycan-associated protein [Ascidiaceihabitans sp.]|jgi:outer membrane protein OmpA-like peptidoglycan-associated protein